MTTAAAAGLVAMVARLSRALPDGDDLAARADRLRAHAVELAGADAAAYAPVLAAQRRPTGDPGRADALHEALAGAARPPLRLAAVAAEVAGLAADLAHRGKRTLRGDVITAATLAAAAARGGTELARINLAAAGAAWSPEHECAATTAERHATEAAGS